MDWYDAVFELIDMRSFSNLWYWLALAAVWSTASHRVLGVPYDVVLRARRQGGQAEADLRDLVRIHTARILYITSVSGQWTVAFVSAGLAGLAMLGFWYGVEFAQAVFLIAFPLTLVGIMSISTARLIVDQRAEGPLLFRRLTQHRRITQVIGMISIFITAMWGMYQNLDVGPLGG